MTTPAQATSLIVRAYYAMADASQAHRDAARRRRVLIELLDAPEHFKNDIGFYVNDLYAQAMAAKPVRHRPVSTAEIVACKT